MRASCPACSSRRTPTPEWHGRTLVDLLWEGETGRSGVDRGRAMGALRRYGLNQQGDQTFGTLSGGQQARFQILLLELSGATLLLLDEPTDNLDVLSAEALEEALEVFEGTVRRGHARQVVRPVAGPVPGLRRGRGRLRVGEPVFEETRVARPR